MSTDNSNADPLALQLSQAQELVKSNTELIQTNNGSGGAVREAKSPTPFVSTTPKWVSSPTLPSSEELKSVASLMSTPMFAAMKLESSNYNSTSHTPTRTKSYGGGNGGSSHMTPRDQVMLSNALHTAARTKEHMAHLVASAADAAIIAQQQAQQFQQTHQSTSYSTPATVAPVSSPNSARFHSIPMTPYVMGNGMNGNAAGGPGVGARSKATSPKGASSSSSALSESQQATLALQQLKKRAGGGGSQVKSNGARTPTATASNHSIFSSSQHFQYPAVLEPDVSSFVRPAKQPMVSPGLEPPTRPTGTPKISKLLAMSPTPFRSFIHYSPQLQQPQPEPHYPPARTPSRTTSSHMHHSIPASSNLFGVSSSTAAHFQSYPGSGARTPCSSQNYTHYDHLTPRTKARVIMQEKLAAAQAAIQAHEQAICEQEMNHSNGSNGSSDSTSSKHEEEEKQQAPNHETEEKSTYSNPSVVTQLPTTPSNTKSTGSQTIVDTASQTTRASSPQTQQQLPSPQTTSTENTKSPKPTAASPKSPASQPTQPDGPAPLLFVNTVDTSPPEPVVNLSADERRKRIQAMREREGLFSGLYGDEAVVQQMEILLQSPKVTALQLEGLNGESIHVEKPTDPNSPAKVTVPVKLPKSPKQQPDPPVIAPEIQAVQNQQLAQLQIQTEQFQLLQKQIEALQRQLMQQQQQQLVPTVQSPKQTPFIQTHTDALPSTRHSRVQSHSQPSPQQFYSPSQALVNPNQLRPKSPAAVIAAEAYPSFSSFSNQPALVVHSPQAITTAPIYRNHGVGDFPLTRQLMDSIESTLGNRTDNGIYAPFTEENARAIAAASLANRRLDAYDHWPKRGGSGNYQQTGTPVAGGRVTSPVHQPMHQPTIYQQMHQQPIQPQSAVYQPVQQQAMYQSPVHQPRSPASPFHSPASRPSAAMNQPASSSFQSFGSNPPNPTHPSHRSMPNSSRRSHTPTRLISDQDIFGEDLVMPLRSTTPSSKSAIQSVLPTFPGGGPEGTNVVVQVPPPHNMTGAVSPTTQVDMNGHANLDGERMLPASQMNNTTTQSPSTMVHSNQGNSNIQPADEVESHRSSLPTNSPILTNTQPTNPSPPMTTMVSVGTEMSARVGSGRSVPATTSSPIISPKNNASVQTQSNDVPAVSTTLEQQPSDSQSATQISPPVSVPTRLVVESPSHSFRALPTSPISSKLDQLLLEQQLSASFKQADMDEAKFRAEQRATAAAADAALAAALARRMPTPTKAQLGVRSPMRQEVNGSQLYNQLQQNQNNYQSQQQQQQQQEPTQYGSFGIAPPNFIIQSAQTNTYGNPPNQLARMPSNMTVPPANQSNTISPSKLDFKSQLLAAQDSLDAAQHAPSPFKTVPVNNETVPPQQQNSQMGGFNSNHVPYQQPNSNNSIMTSNPPHTQAISQGPFTAGDLTSQSRPTLNSQQSLSGSLAHGRTPSQSAFHGVGQQGSVYQVQPTMNQPPVHTPTLSQQNTFNGSGSNQQQQPSQTGVVSSGNNYNPNPPAQSQQQSSQPQQQKPQLPDLPRLPSLPSLPSDPTAYSQTQPTSTVAGNAGHFGPSSNPSQLQQSHQQGSQHQRPELPRLPSLPISTTPQSHTVSTSFTFSNAGHSTTASSSTDNQIPSKPQLQPSQQQQQQQQQPSRSYHSQMPALPRSPSLQIWNSVLPEETTIGMSPAAPNTSNLSANDGSINTSTNQNFTNATSSNPVNAGNVTDPVIAQPALSRPSSMLPSTQPTAATTAALSRLDAIRNLHRTPSKVSPNTQTRTLTGSTTNSSEPYQSFSNAPNVIASSSATSSVPLSHANPSVDRVSDSTQFSAASSSSYPTSSIPVSSASPLTDGTTQPTTSATNVNRSTGAASYTAPISASGATSMTRSNQSAPSVDASVAGVSRELLASQVQDLHASSLAHARTEQTLLDARERERLRAEKMLALQQAIHTTHEAELEIENKQLALQRDLSRAQEQRERESAERHTARAHDAVRRAQDRTQRTEFQVGHLERGISTGATSLAIDAADPSRRLSLTPNRSPNRSRTHSPRPMTDRPITPTEVMHEFLTKEIVPLVNWDNKWDLLNQYHKLKLSTHREHQEKLREYKAAQQAEFERLQAGGDVDEGTLMLEAPLVASSTARDDRQTPTLVAPTNNRTFGIAGVPLFQEDEEPEQTQPAEHKPLSISVTPNTPQNSNQIRMEFPSSTNKANSTNSTAPFTSPTTIASPSTTTTSSSTPMTSPPTNPAPQPLPGNSTAMFPFTSQVPAQISFKKGDRMTIEDKPHYGWWTVHNLRTNERGHVPANFLKEDNPTTTTTA